MPRKQNGAGFREIVYSKVHEVMKTRTTVPVTLTSQSPMTFCDFVIVRAFQLVITPVSLKFGKVRQSIYIIADEN